MMKFFQMIIRCNVQYYSPWITIKLTINEEKIQKMCKRYETTECRAPKHFTDNNIKHISTHARNIARVNWYF